METWGMILVVGFLLGALAMGLGRSEPPVQVIYVPKVAESPTSGGLLGILALVCSLWWHIWYFAKRWVNGITAQTRRRANQ